MTEKLDIVSRVNQVYLKQLGIFHNVKLVKIALNHRAKIIQNAVRERNWIKRFAAIKIQKHWRIFFRRLQLARQRYKEQEELRLKAAVKKIQGFSKLIKTRKVSASLMLNYHQTNLLVQQAILQPVLTKDNTEEEKTEDPEQAEAQKKKEQLTHQEAEKVLAEFEAKLVKV